MARTLSYHQQVAVQQVHELNNRKREQRASVEARIRAETAEALAEIEREESLAAHRALALGVSKATIGRDGLHTRDPYAIARVLEVTTPAEAELGAMFRVPTADERERLELGDTVAAHVTFPGADGTLTGVLARQAGGWAVLEGDAGLADELTDGALPGLLDAWTR